MNKKILEKFLMVKSLDLVIVLVLGLLFGTLFSFLELFTLFTCLTEMKGFKSVVSNSGKIKLYYFVWFILFFWSGLFFGSIQFQLLAFVCSVSIFLVNKYTIEKTKNTNKTKNKEK